MKLLNGRPLAREILERLKKEIAALRKKPGLAAILVGSNPASQLYVSLKEKAANELGVFFHKIVLPDNASTDEVLAAITQANEDKAIHGILIQLPLPSPIDTTLVITAIDPAKDVDGFLRASGMPSPTVQSIFTLLDQAGDMKGKSAALLVNSEAFYQGLTGGLFARDMRVITESDKADVVIVVKGKRNFLRENMIKEGAVVIDVGITVFHGKTVGDSAPGVREKAGAFTPVPGGVGPLTVAYLFKNLVELTRRSEGINSKFYNL